MAPDLFLFSFLGSLLALLVGGLALVVAAGWMLHAAASGKSSRSPDDPLDDEEIRKLTIAFGGPDGLPGPWRRQESLPGEARNASDAPAKGVAAPGFPRRCSFCSWIRQRFTGSSR